MSDGKLKVIFIGGDTRSGSTVLDLALGALTGGCSLGELRLIWEGGFLENILCGCGKPFQVCNFWNEVVKRAFGGFANVDPQHILRLRGYLEETKRVHQLMFPRFRSITFREKLSGYAGLLASLYKAIDDIAGSPIIDSSKSPLHGLILNSIPDLDLYVIHLIRDSRAVAYSWQRKKRREDIPWAEVYMPRYTVTRSAARWTGTNLLTRGLGVMSRHYAVVRYEDFVKQPRETVIQLLERFGLELANPGAFADDSTIILENLVHTVAGNPMRLRQRRLSFRLDDEWKQKMPAHKRITVTALTWPLLLRCGYFRGGRLR